MKKIQKYEDFVNEEILNEAATWDVEVIKPYDEKAERKAANFKIKQDPITVVGVSGQIDDDYTDVSVQFSNGDRIDYNYKFSPRGGSVKTIGITKNDKFMDISDDSERYFGSTGTVIGDLCLIYHDFTKGKIS